MRNNLEEMTVCIIGLGYVGLPLARAFARSFRVIGFDLDSKRVNKLNQENDLPCITFTDDAGEIGNAGCIFICVPTPVTEFKEPDLSFVKSAAKIVSQHMREGSVVVLESTVYPGVTEEIVKPILEESGLKCGQDFKIAYSPERINPGDETHTVDKMPKVVAGMDVETSKFVAALYGKITSDVFIAKDIKTAEAAKVIENIQRDLNIALMNELALIFGKMGLSTRAVLDAAETKWNFHRYSPGLVGGHCIPVDPYYLVYKAKELGYSPQVILAGRSINDSMPKRITEMAVEALGSAGKAIKGSKVLIMGLTYKEDVADIRETPVKGIIRELQKYEVEIFGYDPLLENIEEEFGVKAISNLEDLSYADCIILTVSHRPFENIGVDRLKELMSDPPVLIDVRGIFAKEAEEKGFYYRTL
ncbi:nucleotide sugar dehydrogenase [Chloroflexota bacterium]